MGTHADDELEVTLTHAQCAVIALALGYSSLADIIDSSVAYGIIGRIMAGMPTDMRTEVEKAYKRRKESQQRQQWN